MKRPTGSQRRRVAVSPLAKRQAAAQVQPTVALTEALSNLSIEQAPQLDVIEQDTPVGSMNGGLLANLQQRFQLGQALGQGAFGQVFEATDKLDGSRYALKLLSEKVSRDPKAAQAEYKVLELLTTDAGMACAHPNIVCYYDHFYTLYDSQEPRLAVLMELIEGSDLRKIAKQQRLRYDEFLRIAEALFAGLAFMHERGVAHRDIKPDNVMQERGTKIIKLIDLGISCVEDVRAAEGLLACGLDRAGTPAYMSPEASAQALSARGQMAADVWAAGLTMFFLLNGSMPLEKYPFPQAVLFTKQDEIVDEILTDARTRYADDVLMLELIETLVPTLEDEAQRPSSASLVDKLNTLAY